MLFNIFISFLRYTPYNDVSVEILVIIDLFEIVENKHINKIKKKFLN